MKKAVGLILLLTALFFMFSCGVSGPAETAEPTQLTVPEETDGSGQASEAFFSLLSIDGETVSSSDFPGAKLFLVNFFESWCGPCVSEMPALEQLSREYADKGLVVIGVFYTSGRDDDVRQVMDYTGITYPILHGDDALDEYTNYYIPSTVFFDCDGNTVGEEIVGPRDYAAWVNEVEKLLG